MGHDWGSNEQFNTHGNLSWGSKVGQIRSNGTSNMVLINCFHRFFFILHIFSPPKKKKFHSDCFWGLFSIKQDTFLILKLLITFVKELVLGQGSFSAKCTGLGFNFGNQLPVCHQNRIVFNLYSCFFCLFGFLEQDATRNKKIQYSMCLWIRLKFYELQDYFNLILILISLI